MKNVRDFFSEKNNKIFIEFGKNENFSGYEK
jgi:hypothetical protein